MEQGYVKLWRKCLDSGLLQNGPAWQLFGYLLLKSTYRPHRQIVGGMVFDLKPGEVVFGRAKAASDLGLSEKQVRTAFELLKKLEIVASRSTNRCTVVLFLNWHRYQDEGPAEGQQKGQPEGQQEASKRASRGPAEGHKQERNKERINTERVFNACARVERPAENPEPEAVPSRHRQPPVAFDEFFEAFPEQHRGGRNEAAGEWVALEANRALPGLPRILDALGQWEDSEAWRQQGGRYIPSAANFLRREYWLRKPPEPAEQGGNGDQARPRAATVAQQRVQDNDDMAKMLLQARRAQHAQPGLHASTAGQSGAALPAGR